VPDVAVAQGDEADTSKLDHVTEAELPGHLAAEGETKKETMIIRPAPGKKYDDFQLSYALDLLHGRMTVSSIQTKSVEAN
jgi:carboxyl-terminal processing protease